MKNLSVPYAAAVYGKEEVEAVRRVLKNPQKIVAGYRVREFEKKVAKLFGKKYGVMVNSGSSANLIALGVLNLPEGSEVITPSLTFATTVAPILQHRLKPVFVDVEHGTYVINPNDIEPLITPKTKAIIVPSLIGNIPDLPRIRKIADRYNIFVVEDSCDTLGATISGKPTGKYSDISTTSFYASHVITAAGGGGMVVFHDRNLYKRALVMSNWGRNSTLFGFYERSEEVKKRFAGRIGDMHYDAKFIFSEIGYNMQSNELAGAFGLEQLRKLREFSQRRKGNFAELLKFFRQYEKYFILPKQNPRVDTNWLAFPLTIREEAPFTRLEITKYLEERGIQTRPIFTGNILRQPAFAHLASLQKKRFVVADHIMLNGFLVGCHHGLGRKHLSYLKEAFEKFLVKYAR